jgi:hypothetical protein
MVERIESDEQSKDIAPDKLIRINIKQNFKKEKAYEYTIRGDTVDEIQALKARVKAICETEMLGG